jgi:hypothetical protein
MGILDILGYIAVGFYVIFILWVFIGALGLRTGLVMGMVVLAVTAGGYMLFAGSVVFLTEALTPR